LDDGIAKNEFKSMLFILSAPVELKDIETVAP
jgi:hypothetical protein